MKTWTIQVEEMQCRLRRYTVEADTEAEAREKADAGDTVEEIDLDDFPEVTGRVVDDETLTAVATSP